MPELSTWLAGDGAFKPEHYKLGVAAVSNFDSPAVADGRTGDLSREEGTP